MNKKYFIAIFLILAIVLFGCKYKEAQKNGEIVKISDTQQKSDENIDDELKNLTSPLLEP